MMIKTLLEIINNSSFILVGALASTLATIFITVFEKARIRTKESHRTKDAVLVFNYIDGHVTEQVKDYLLKNEILSNKSSDFCFVDKDQLLENNTVFNIKLSNKFKLIEITPKKREYTSDNPLNLSPIHETLTSISKVLYDSDVRTLHIFYAGPIEVPFIISSTLQEKFEIKLYRYDISSHSYSYIGKIDHKEYYPIGSISSINDQDYYTRKKTSINSINSQATAFSPDGKYIMTASKKVAYLWNTQNKSLLYVLEGHKANITSIAFSPDSKCSATGSYDGTVRIWDVETGESSVLQELEVGITSIAFTPDGRYIVTTALDKEIHLWDFTSKSSFALKGTVDFTSVAFSHDGEFLIASSIDGTTFEWNLSTFTIAHIYLPQRTLGN